MQYAKPGQWGRGLYFAVDPGYCDCGYASTAKTTSNAPGRPSLQPDERELLQASLLLGRVVEMDRGSNNPRDQAAMKKRCK